MRKHIFLFVMAWIFTVAAAPSRTCTYTPGQVISPTCVGENEDNIFSYLQGGVDTYKTDTVNSTAITDGTIANADISSSAAITYGKLTLTGSLVAGDIATGAVTSTGILDGTITASDLNATITPADGALINLSSINVSSSSEGLILPQTTSCTSGTAEGQICWDTDNDMLFVGTASAAQTIGLPKAFVSTFTRDTTVASGTQTISGLGLTPIAVYIQCPQGGSRETSWGISDGTNQRVQLDFSSDAYDEVSGAINDYESAGVLYTGTVGSFTSGQYIITWTRTSTPSGTLNCNSLAIGY